MSPSHCRQPSSIFFLSHSLTKLREKVGCFIWWFSLATLKCLTSKCVVLANLNMSPLDQPSSGTSALRSPEVETAKLHDLSFPEEMASVFLPLTVTATSPLRIRTPACGKHLRASKSRLPHTTRDFKRDNVVPPVLSPQFSTCSQLLNVSCGDQGTRRLLCRAHTMTSRTPKGGEFGKQPGV